MQTVIFFLIMLALSTSLQAQEKCPFRLLRNPVEIADSGKGGLAFKRMSILYKTNSILIETCNKEKKAFKSSLVWGYLEKGQTIYRNYGNEFFKVETMSDSMVIYSRKSMGYKGHMINTYFFSKKLDAPIHLLDKENSKNK